MRAGNHKAQTVQKKDKEAFLRERNTRGNKVEGLSLLQENVISYLHAGFSMSYIARNIYKIHPNTLSNAVNSAKFVQVLNEVNEATQLVSMQMIIKKLSEIITNSTNEQNIISACKTLAAMLPSITQKELYEVLISNNIDMEEATNLLNSISLSEEEEGAEDEEAK